MPETTRRKMEERLHNEMNMMKRAEEAAIYEMDILHKLQKEASYINPEVKEKLDKLYDEIESKNNYIELSTEVKEALSSIFSEGE